MVTIPGKQLIIEGTRSALENNLLEREIGFCLDDSLCYVKQGGSLHVLGGPPMTDAELSEIISILG